MQKAHQAILAIGLWAIVGAGCAGQSPALNSPLNSPLSKPASAHYVYYTERGTTLVYAINPSEEGGFGFLALIGGRIVRVNGCLLLEKQGHYALPLWSHRVSFVDSGSEELVVAANGKIVGTVGKSINPDFGGGYFTVANLTETGSPYQDAQTPTCNGIYDSIAWVNLR